MRLSVSRILNGPLGYFYKLRTIYGPAGPTDYFTFIVRL